MGEDLVYLHGAGGQAVWTPDLDALAGAFRVTVPFHPGLGESSGADGIDGVLDSVLLLWDTIGELGSRRVRRSTSAASARLVGRLEEVSMPRVGLVRAARLASEVSGASPAPDAFGAGRGLRTPSSNRAVRGGPSIAGCEARRTGRSRTRRTVSVSRHSARPSPEVSEAIKPRGTRPSPWSLKYEPRWWL